MTREGWKEISLGKLCTLRAGSVFKTHYQGSTEGDFQFIKVSDMNLPGNQFCIHEANHWVDDSVRAEMRAKPFPEGTTVFAKIGEALKQNRVRFLVRGTLIDNNMMGAIPNRDVIDPEFFFYRLSDFNIAATATGTALPYLTISALAQERFAIPPIPVQRRIASVLSAYDKLIKNNQRRIQILETMARALYREWFVEFRFPGHEKIPRVASAVGDIPQGWETKKLGDIIELKYGKALKKTNRCDGECPIFGSSGIVGYHDKSLVKGPGIIVGRKGNVGSVFWSDEDFFVIDTAYFVTSSVPLRFLFYDLQTKNFINNDAAVPGLNRYQAYALEILAPPPDLIERFCKLADNF